MVFQKDCRALKYVLGMNRSSVKVIKHLNARRIHDFENPDIMGIRSLNEINKVIKLEPLYHWTAPMLEGFYHRCPNSELRLYGDCSRIFNYSLIRPKVFNYETIDLAPFLRDDLQNVRNGLVYKYEKTTNFFPLKWLEKLQIAPYDNIGVILAEDLSNLKILEIGHAKYSSKKSIYAILPELKGVLERACNLEVLIIRQTNLLDGIELSKELLNMLASCTGN